MQQQNYYIVCLNFNWVVYGKEYYGNVYFVDGTKYAGTTSDDGTDIRVYDTRLESIQNPTSEKLQ